jgi:hypothetical protein
MGINQIIMSHNKVTTIQCRLQQIEYEELKVLYTTEIEEKMQCKKRWSYAEMDLKERIYLDRHQFPPAENTHTGN